MLKGFRLASQGKSVRLVPTATANPKALTANSKALLTRTSNAPGASAIKGFVEFIKNGNIVDLAVAVVIGTAFAALVTQFTDSFLTPLIAVTTGGGDVGGQFSFNGQAFTYGAFVGAIITFLNTAAVIYFLVVLPMNKFLRREHKAALDEVTPDVQLLTEIRDLLLAQQQQRQPEQS